MDICWLLILGLFIGAVARLVVPGYQPIGFILTMLVGVLGIVGGDALADTADITGVLHWILVIGVTAILVLIVAAATRKSRE